MGNNCATGNSEAKGRWQFLGSFFGTVGHDNPTLNPYMSLISTWQNSKNTPTFYDLQDAGPTAGLIQDAAGNLYGTTYGAVQTSDSNKLQGAGTVFKWTPGTGLKAIRIFHSLEFPPGYGGGSADGFYPSGKLLLDGDYLYGTTEQGGALGSGKSGTIFRIDLKNNNPFDNYKVLHNFEAAKKNGVVQPYARAPIGENYYTNPYANRYSGLIKGSDGYLYGVRRDGGDFNAGTIFRLKPDGNAYEILYSFPANQGTPAFELVEVDKGIFYGTTQAGGDYGQGSIFRFYLPKKQLLTIQSFSDSHWVGGVPSTALVFGHDKKDLYGGTRVPGDRNSHDNAKGSVYRVPLALN
jgi:uncharacterized repeat protein (TIGR03803 family)